MRVARQPPSTGRTIEVYVIDTGQHAVDKPVTQLLDTSGVGLQAFH